MLSVFNCGQGDAMRLKPNHCYWDDIPLYIDLGPASFRKSIPDNQIDLLLTHCHDDHVSGSTFPNNMLIRDLYLPAYLPEYYKIMNKLNIRMPKLPLPRNGKATLVYDGFRMGQCRHNLVLNPPLDPMSLFQIGQIDDDIVNDFLKRFDTTVNDILSTSSRFEFEIIEPDGYQAKEFVRAAVYLIALKRTSSLEQAIKQFRNVDSNSLSVVFNFSSSEYSLLLTGDADKPVFNRLIRRGERRLKATVLKAPHHGSKHSLNKKILSFISPNIVIFSHDNGLFGRATDPHPNQQVLTDTLSIGCSNYFTNDVVKNGKKVYPGHTGAISNCNVEIL